MVNLISIILIISAAFIALSAIFLGLRIKKSVPADIQDKWIFILYFLTFLFFGCLIYAGILMFKNAVPYELVTAIIFLAGTGYIYIVMKLIGKTILRIVEKDESSEERLKILFEYIPDAIFLTDMKGTFIDCNKAAEKLSGYNRKEVIGKNFQKLKLITLKQVPKVLLLLAESALGRPTGPDELILKRKDGKRLDIEIKSYPVIINNNKVVLGIAHDISERKKFEKTLQESEGRYRSVVETSADMIFITDRKTGKILDLNRSVCELMGYSKNEMIGTVSGDRIGPFQRDEYKKEFKRLRETGKCSGEFRIRKKDGTDIIVELSGAMSGDYLFVISRDITDRKRTEELIELQLSRLNVLHSIEKAVNSSLDLRATFDHLVEQVTTQLGIDAAAVLILNRHTQVLEYMVSKGFRSSALKHTRLKFGEGYGGSAAKERRTITVSDLGKEPGAFSNSKDFTTEGFITYFAVPLVAKGEVKGVMELFHRLHMDAEPDWLEFLETIADQVSIAIDNAALFNDLQSSRNELISAYDSTIVGWSHAMDMRDKETEGHSQRVTEITL